MRGLEFYYLKNIVKMLDNIGMALNTLLFYANYTSSGITNNTEKGNIRIIFCYPKFIYYMNLG